MDRWQTSKIHRAEKHHKHWADRARISTPVCAKNRQSAYQTVQHDQGKGPTVAAPRRAVGRRFFSLRRNAAVIAARTRTPVDHPRDHDLESSVVSFTRPGPATDVKPLQSRLPADRLFFLPREKVVKPTETTSNFSPPDPTAPQADAPTQPLPLPAPAQRGRPCRQPRGPGLPYLTAPPIGTTRRRRQQTRAVALAWSRTRSIHQPSRSASRLFSVSNPSSKVRGHDGACRE